MAEKRFLSLDDLTHLPAPTWAIEGMFEKDSLVMIAGPPASYKSFMALDWMMCMVTGRNWLNRHTMRAKVLYVLGEGKASLLKRMQTWMHYHQVTEAERTGIVDNFRVAFDVPQMSMKSSIDNMLAQLQAEQFSPDVIVVDTFARSFVGMDENSQKDTGLWIESADRLRQQGYTVIFLHHTAKNTEFGLKYRGSTAIMGAMDTAMVMDKDYQNHARVVLKVTKQKDHDEGPPLFFNRLIVKPYGPNDEGSIVLTPSMDIDERYTEEGVAQEQALAELAEDESYKDDAERGRILHSRFQDISAEAWEKRLRRRKQKGSVH